jgi:hypothetical protein
LVPHDELKAVMTISSGFAGFTAMLVSPSLKVSVFLRIASVLLTTTSTIVMTLKAPEMLSGSADSPAGAESSGIAGRA